MNARGPVLPFDEVLLKEGAVETVHTPEAFLAMPLHRRVGCIISGRAQFFLRGEQVPTDLALRALRQSAAPSPR